MNPALQFLELVDKDAVKIFNEFIEKYSAPKVKKEPKPEKVKVDKPKKVKVDKPEKVKVEKPEKVVKTDNQEPSALDILIKIKSNKKPKPKNYVLEIQKFIDEINEYMENNSNYIENKYEELFLDLEFLDKIQKQKNKHFDI
jgi:CRISPR/Cas system-associated endonuclease Cas3-HD